MPGRFARWPTGYCSLILSRSCVRLAAEQARDEWKVLWARAAYLRAISPSVATARYPMNVTRALEALDVPYSTVRPYILAGQALAHEGRAHRTSPAEQIDLDIVEAAMDQAARAPRRASRNGVRQKNR